MQVRIEPTKVGEPPHVLDGGYSVVIQGLEVEARVSATDNGGLAIYIAYRNDQTLTSEPSHRIRTDVYNINPLQTALRVDPVR